MRVIPGDRQHLGRNRFGQAIGELRAIGHEDLADTTDLRRGLRRTGRIVADDQHMHVARRLRGRRYRVECRALDRRVVVFRNYECSHVVSLDFQMALASFFSLLTRVATSGTLMPALRAGGSLTLSVFNRGVTSTPSSAGLIVSSGFFFAFMMFGSVT